MRSIDFAPLPRSSIGFDRVFELLEHAARTSEHDKDYPPYTIKTVAGFAPDELAVTVERDVLIITGRRLANPTRKLIYQGIPGGGFERRFSLADLMRVGSARFSSGILSIDLEREAPAAMIPRKIAIATETRSIKAKPT
jgi:molecular chaperone IbpA